MNKKYAHAVEPQSESGSSAEEFWQRGYSTVLSVLLVDYDMTLLIVLQVMHILIPTFPSAHERPK